MLTNKALFYNCCRVHVKMSTATLCIYFVITDFSCTISSFGTPLNCSSHHTSSTHYKNRRKKVCNLSSKSFKIILDVTISFPFNYPITCDTIL